MLLINGSLLGSILPGSLCGPEVLTASIRASRRPRSPGPVLSDESAQRGCQRRPSLLQLGDRMDGQLSQDRLAARRELDDDGASVGLGPTPPDHAAIDEPVHELDGGVVSDLQALGQ